MNYHPYGRLILLRLSSTDAVEVQSTAQRVVDALIPKDDALSQYEILGPAPASILRVSNRYRWQIWLKFAQGVPQFQDWDQV